MILHIIQYGGVEGSTTTIVRGFHDDDVFSDGGREGVENAQALVSASFFGQHICQICDGDVMIY